MTIEIAVFICIGTFIMGFGIARGIYQQKPEDEINEELITPRYRRNLKKVVHNQGYDGGD